MHFWLLLHYSFLIIGEFLSDFKFLKELSLRISCLVVLSTCLFLKKIQANKVQNYAYPESFVDVRLKELLQVKLKGSKLDINNYKKTINATECCDGYCHTCSLIEEKTCINPDNFCDAQCCECSNKYCVVKLFTYREQSQSLKIFNDAHNENRYLNQLSVIEKIMMVHIGKKNQIDWKTLAKAAAIKGNKRIPTYLKVQEMIDRLKRKSDLPIGNTNKGYFLIETSKERSEQEKYYKIREEILISHKRAFEEACFAYFQKSKKTGNDSTY